MNDKRNATPQAGGIVLADIYYVLFRHKWKIISLSAAGLLVAAGIYVRRPATYQSEANLLIKYVSSNKPQLGLNMTDGQSLKDVDGGVDGIINTEVAIISSFDLALQVATNIGPEKILARLGGGDDRNRAASAIKEYLIVDHYPKSPVLRVMFSHPDPTLVQPILKSLIDNYQQKHTQIHGAIGSGYDSLVAENDNLKHELLQTEEELRRAKNKANVTIDLEDTKRSNAAMITQTHQQIMVAAAELAGHQAMLAKLKGSASATNATPATNATTKVEAEIPQDKIDQYTQAVEFFASLQRDYYRLLNTYPEHNTFVQEKLAQVTKAKNAKLKLEQEEPRLAKLNVAVAKTAGQPGAFAGDSILNEEAQVLALQQKIEVLQFQMAQIHTNNTNLDSEAPTIRNLELKRMNQEEYYKRSLTALQQAEIDSQLGAAKNANIETTQSPTPPALDRAKTPKMMGVAIMVGIVAGLAWAFLVEFYLDHSVKRAKEIETTMGMRLFLSIPDISQKGYRRKLLAAAKAKGGAKELAEKSLVPTLNGAAGENDKVEIAPWDKNHSLHQHYEALRDRLITYFEVNNLNHKPKLVAVTGSGGNCGTTTIAAGLAASLSETGDGNVLLIDMNLEHGAAQQFYMGRPGCGLDAALANETRDSAMIQNKLYVVSGNANGDKLSRMLPKKFANLLPKLKASDYDYIIFDMPPISRTGVAQRLAGFMDMTLLVVESEKTSRDLVKQAAALLAESKANVSVVLNKTRDYVPTRLHQEI